MSAIYVKNIVTYEVVSVVRRNHGSLDLALVANVFHAFIKLHALLTGWLAIDEYILRRLRIVVAKYATIHVYDGGLIGKIETPIVVRVIGVFDYTS